MTEPEFIVIDEEYDISDEKYDLPVHPQPSIDMTMNPPSQSTQQPPQSTQPPTQSTYLPPRISCVKNEGDDKQVLTGKQPHWCSVMCKRIVQSISL